MAHDVFISHSSKDKLTADAICHALEQSGIPCWIAPRDVRAGFDYPAEIMFGIENSKLMILIFSEESNSSPFVYAEVERAFSKSKMIIPYRLSQTEMNRNLEFILSGKHWIDAYPNDTVFAELVTAVKNALGVPAETVAQTNQADAASPVSATPAAVGTSGETFFEKKLKQLTLPGDCVVYMTYIPSMYTLHCFYRNGEVMETGNMGTVGIGQISSAIHAGEWPVIDPNSYYSNGRYEIKGDTLTFEMKRMTPHAGAWTAKKTGKLSGQVAMDVKTVSFRGEVFNDTLRYCGSLINGKFVPSDDYYSLWQ